MKITASVQSILLLVPFCFVTEPVRAQDIDSLLESVGTEAVLHWDVQANNRLMIGAAFISSLHLNPAL